MSTIQPIQSIITNRKISEIFESYQELLNKSIKVSGWIKTYRTQKDMTFLSLNDGSTIKNIQIVFNTSILTPEQLNGLGFGSSIITTGLLIESPVPAQPFELQLTETTNLEVCGSIIGINPLPAKGKITLEFLRTIPHLRPRTNTFGAIARMRHQLAMATHDFLGKDKGFILVAPPQITQNDCEGGGEAFQVTTLLTDVSKITKSLTKPGVELVDKTIQSKKTKEIINDSQTSSLSNNLIADPIVLSGKIDYSEDFFKSPAYLTVSGQLALETYCLALGGVYCYQSAFRADPSQTSRHVAEFTMLEVEIPFANLSDNMNLAEEYIKHSIKYVMTTCFTDMEFLDQYYYQKKSDLDKFKPTLVEYLTNIIESDFARMKYSEVMEILLKVQSDGHKFEVPIPEIGVFDFKAEHERYLTDIILKKPVFVTHYPAEIKAFYMKPSNEIDQKLGVQTVECCDLLVPGIGEVLGGSCRTSSYEKLLESMKTHGLVESNGSSNLDYYLDLRKYGSIDHCGFGIGMSRLLMMITGMENIRDMIEFPRTIGSIRF
jgi:asparaginyl-tRNA synthetase